MGKLFGTDGIRGVVNAGLDADLAYKVGLAAAGRCCQRQKAGEKLVTIGKDTRISGDLLKGLFDRGTMHRRSRCAGPGHSAHPGVGLGDGGREGGHPRSSSLPATTPLSTTGSKFSTARASSCPTSWREKIEDIVLFAHNNVPRKTGGGDRQGELCGGEAALDYIDHLEGTITSDLAGLRILVDCANGASYTTAARLFDRFPKLPH